MADFKGKVKGMMYGIAVGDALGQPYENKQSLGRPVNDYLVSGGQTTDDWQMSAVLARSLMQAGKFDMDDMARGHVAAYDDTTRGWGGAHRDACRLLKEGVSHSEAGNRLLREDKPYRGRGNGMAMKIGPLAAYNAAKMKSVGDRVSDYIQLSKMTHHTGLGLSSAMGMAEAVIFCLNSSPETFDRNDFLHAVKHAVEVAELCVNNDFHPDKLSTLINYLCDNWDLMTPEVAIQELKGGGYVYQSLPFALAFFCMGSGGVSGVYDCAGAGGDTDTNASMVAALVGALNGPEVFPASLLYNLVHFDDIDLIAGQFANWCDGQKS